MNPLAAIAALGDGVELLRSLNPPVSVTVTTATATVNVGQTQTFSAVVANATNTSVTWSVSGGGTIDAGGLYTAPSRVRNGVDPPSMLMKKYQVPTKAGSWPNSWAIFVTYKPNASPQMTHLANPKLPGDRNGLANRTKRLQTSGTRRTHLTPRTSPCKTHAIQNSTLRGLPAQVVRASFLRSQPE